MKRLDLRHRMLLLLACLALSGMAGTAAADPSYRVARLGYTDGAVSFSPAGESDWLQASLNRPLNAGDRLWTEPRARAEIQLGGAVIRAGGETSLVVLNVDDRIAQVQLTQGTLNVRVRRLDRDQVLEVDTPNLAFTFRAAGEFRIEVDPEGRSTAILVRSGRGEAYGEGASYVIDSRQPYRFTGTGLRDYQYLDPPRFDDFDRWSSERDRRFDSSASARYVSPEVVGYEDLDGNGDWRADATYGRVWYPSRVAADWAPYRDGHWAWIDPWGWTWMDDAPWGYAVSHYGRWTNHSGRWGWVPGPVRSRAYYAPALVAFVGGGVQLSIAGANAGGVAWFPLAPREVYRPAYQVSRGYFEQVNRSNTVVTTVVVNNYYKNPGLGETSHANRRVAGAVIAVPSAAFVQSQAVARSSVRLSAEAAGRAPAAFVPAVAPSERSVRGASQPGGKPPVRAFERPVVARNAPPPVAAGFAAQREQLAAHPGKPLDATARTALKPAVAMPAVTVVNRAQAAPAPTRPPPALAPAGRANAGRGTFNEGNTSPMPAAPASAVAKPATPPPREPAAAPSKPATPPSREPAAVPSKPVPHQEAPRARPKGPEDKPAGGRGNERKQDPGEAKSAAPPPRPPAATEKPVAPPPRPPVAVERPAAPPPRPPAATEKPVAPPPRAPVAVEKPAAPPPRPPAATEKPVAAPPRAPAPVEKPVAPPRPPERPPAAAVEKPAAPTAKPKGPGEKPAGEKGSDRKKDKDESKPEEGNRKQKD